MPTALCSAPKSMPVEGKRPTTSNTAPSRPGQLGNPCTSFPISDGSAGSAVTFQSVSAHLFELTPETEYHWRVVATNVVETAASADHTFTTFPSGGVTNDPCSNAHVRQQTGAALLSDCRAYELVSAAKRVATTSSRTLLRVRLPSAAIRMRDPARVLYAVNDGGIPGTNHPTNKGPDPYVATRGEEGWSTVYVGVPADNSFSAAPFSSVPSGADSSLDAFAFGGTGGCSPCFEGGYTGIPVRLPDGELRPGHGGPAESRPHGKAGWLRRQEPLGDGSTSSSARPPSSRKAAMTKPATSRSTTTT